MDKMIKYFLTKDFAILFLFIGIQNIANTPVEFIKLMIIVITASSAIEKTVRLFSLIFGKEKNNYFIRSELEKKNKYEKTLGTEKAIFFLCTFIPLIINPFLCYELFESLTIPIIWGILLIEDILFFLILKNRKKEFLNGV